MVLESFLSSIFHYQYCCNQMSPNENKITGHSSLSFVHFMMFMTALEYFCFSPQSWKKCKCTFFCSLILSFFFLPKVAVINRNVTGSK